MSGHCGVRSSTHASSPTVQDDTFLPTMSVGETCAMYAALTLPRGTPRAHAAQRITEVLQAVGLSHVRDTLVGAFYDDGVALYVL